MPNKQEYREECRELEYRERESVLQQGVARGVLVALWLGIAASPLLLLVAATMLLGLLSLGDQELLHYWQLLLLVGGVTGVGGAGSPAPRFAGLLCPVDEQPGAQSLANSGCLPSAAERNRIAANWQQVTRAQR